MRNSSLPELLETHPELPAPRRRVLQAALAVAAGGSVHSFAPGEAFAQSARPPGTQQRQMAPMQDAIKACQDCHSMCLRMAMGYSLQRGGKHVAQEHFRLMLNCAELCQTSANFMLSNSPLHGRVCGVCAEACEACAKSCEEVGDMSECVEECQRCAKSCRTMS